MSSGQKRRISANFPNMNYRLRARDRHLRRTVREFNAMSAAANFANGLLFIVDHDELAVQFDNPWAVVGPAPRPVPDEGNFVITCRRWLPGIDERVEITEKGRAVVESGLTERQAHEIETGCQPDALCAECQEMCGA